MCGSDWIKSKHKAGLFAIKLRKIRNFFSKNKVVPNCFSMFSQLDPSFGGSKSKICHHDLMRKKNYRLLCPKGYQKSVPYVTVTIWAMEILKEGFKNNNMAQIHPRLLGHNNY